MKRHILFIALYVSIVAPGAARADVTLVDFGTVGVTTDITAPAGPVPVSGVNFSYDNFGNQNVFAVIQPPDVGGIPRGEIFGIPGGTLTMDFDPEDPARGLFFDFSLTGVHVELVENGKEPDALFITLSRNGQPIVPDILVAADFVPYFPDDPAAGGDVFGRFGFVGDGFDSAQMAFDDAEFFHISNMSYIEASEVPEPAGLAIWAAGLAGLGGWRLFGRKPR
jgi:hypothetical protein